MKTSVRRPAPSGPGWYAPTPRPRRWVWLAAVVMVALGGLTGLFWLGIHGGWDGVREDWVPTPRPEDPAMQARMATVRAQADVDLHSLLPTGPYIAGATTDDDGCWQGQNNYKVHDGYVWECSISGGRIYAFDGDFNTVMGALDTQLAAEGWNTSMGIIETRNSYAERRTVNDLPTVWYDRNDYAQTMDFRFAEPAGTFNPMSLDKWPQGWTSAQRLLKTHDYVVIVSFGRDYFKV